MKISRVTTLIVVFSLFISSKIANATELENWEIPELEQCNTLIECDSVINEIDNSLNNFRKEENEKQNIKDSLKEERYALRDQATVIQKQINAINEKILLIQNNIEKASSEIKNLNQDIKNQKTFVERQMVISQRLKFQNPILSLISESHSFTDLTKNVRNINHFAKYAQKQIQELSDLVSQQQILLSTLKDDRIELDEQQKNLKQKEEELTFKMEEMINLEQRLQQDIQALQSLTIEAAEIKEIMEEQRNSIIESTNEKFMIPLQKGYVSCEFECYTDSKGIIHNGIDLGNYGDTTTPVLAAASGTVTRSGWHTSYGNHVMITHNINNQIFTTVYAHMNSQPLVSIGDELEQGSQIGTMGTTGNSSGPHLHFELYEGYYNWPYSVNPKKYITFPKYW